MKARLLRENAEDLDILPPEERKLKLAFLYQQQEQHYDQLIKKPDILALLRDHFSF